MMHLSETEYAQLMKADALAAKERIAERDGRRIHSLMFTKKPGRRFSPRAKQLAEALTDEFVKADAMGMERRRHDNDKLRQLVKKGIAERHLPSIGQLASYCRGPRWNDREKIFDGWE